ncbi:MAG TPA: phosphopentomutase [Candidatus Wallbacteria bacterium]|nr:phosphopentomutase [Candidatus Wallbacteria bacterium]
MARVILIVLDSVGIGEMPDAAKYGDYGVNTFSNIARDYKNFKVDNLVKLGISNIEGVANLQKCPAPEGAFARLEEVSPGKDTTTGHWEMMGVRLTQEFPTYPKGFPADVIEEFEKRTGRKTIGNCTASGTEIIERLGEEHQKTGALIVYTSADSVFQIAAHEQTVPIEQLYEYCKTARSILRGKHAVGRVIARPFDGVAGAYKRTSRRHDYSLEPPKNLLDFLKESDVRTAGVGKIYDIFACRGLSDYVTSSSNLDGINKTIDYMHRFSTGLIFTNLVDFDMVYGHRRDVEGYAKSLMEFDSRLPEIIKNMNEKDILMITADHGCDPTYTKTTDHTREYVPLLIYGHRVRKGLNLNTVKGFTCIAKTIGSLLGLSGEYLSQIEGEDLTAKILD